MTTATQPIAENTPASDTDTPKTSGIGPKTLSVTLGGKRYHVPYTTGKTVLQACKDAGITPPSSCERGRCGTCRALLKYGDVDRGKFRKRALSDEDIEKGRILTCQAKPSSTVPFGLTYDEDEFSIANPAGAPPISKARVVVVTFALIVLAGLIHLLKNAVL